jgi:hypothetical protein
MLLLDVALAIVRGDVPTPPPEIPSAVIIVLGGVFSSGTLIAVVGLIRDIRIERGKRKDAAEAAAVSQQKDAREGESVREGEYRALAEQARKSAETAVNVIKASLDATQGTVELLQGVIASQNSTIAALTAAQGEQSELLRSALADREAARAALAAAEAKRAHEEREKIRLEAELAEKDRDLKMLDDLVYASVGIPHHRPPTGQIPVVTSKE